MKIAKIVSSGSHIDYIARVIDELDTDLPPRPEDFGFGQFVIVDRGGVDAVGVIYNSVLANPDYANFGPRLSPRTTLESFSPDFLNEQGILLGILLVGTAADGHGIPRRVVTAGADVETMPAEELSSFHTHRGKLEISYYSQVFDHAGIYASPLLANIIEQLSATASPADVQRLDVLKRSLEWQRTMGYAKS